MRRDVRDLAARREVVHVREPAQNSVGASGPAIAITVYAPGDVEHEAVAGRARDVGAEGRRTEDERPPRRDPVTRRRRAPSTAVPAGRTSSFVEVREVGDADRGERSSSPGTETGTSQPPRSSNIGAGSR